MGIWTDRAMEMPLVKEAQASGVVVTHDVARGMCVFEDEGWGPYGVSEEAVMDIERVAGPEMGWMFLRYGTTPDGNRLMMSYESLLRWAEPQAT